MRNMRSLILSIFALLFSTPAFAASPLTRFMIDPTTRGPSVAEVITTLNKTPYSDTPRAEVAMQLQLGEGFTINNSFAPVAAGASGSALQGGFVPYVKAAKAYETLLVVTYQLNASASSSPYYLVVPIERIVAIMYSPQAIAPPITASIPSNVLPLYSVNPVTRAADLVSVFKELNTSSVYKTSLSAVGMFITLTADYNPPIYNGFIPNIETIVASGPFLYITYLPSSNAGMSYKTAQTIVVSAEQVNQLVYFANKKNVTLTGGL